MNSAVGSAVGCWVGSTVGWPVGCWVGSTVGSGVGFCPQPAKIVVANNEAKRI